MLDPIKEESLKRLSYIEGHLKGIRKMVEEDKYCVDVLHQTSAVRKAIEKLEMVMLDGHLRDCVVEGIRDGRADEVISELLGLYGMVGTRTEGAGAAGHAHAPASLPTTEPGGHND